MASNQRPLYRDYYNDTDYYRYHGYSQSHEEKNDIRTRVVGFLKRAGFTGFKDVTVRKMTAGRVESYNNLHEHLYDELIKSEKGIQMEISEVELFGFFDRLTQLERKYNHVSEDYNRLDSKERKESRIRNSNPAAQKAYEHYQMMLALAGDPTERK